MSNNRLRAPLLLSMLAVLMTALFAIDAGSNPVTAQERTGSQITDATARAMANCMPLYRVNVGGGQLTAIDNFVYPWEANGNQYLDAGGNNISTYDNVAIPTVDPLIADRVPMQLFQSERWDPAPAPEMRWEFPIGTVGEYDLIFYFAEMFSGNSQPGDRVFSVSAEGTPLLTDFDIAATHGFRYGVAHAFTLLVSDHSLTIDFTRMSGNPAIHGIEIVPHTCVNVYPYANDDMVSTALDTPVTYDILANDGDDGPLDLTSVDLDPVTAGQQLSVTNPGQATFNYDTTTGEVTVTPAPGFLGATAIDYTVRDSSARLSNVASFQTIVYETVDCPAVYRVNAGGRQLAALDGGIPWSEDRAALESGAYGAADAGTPSPYVNAAAIGDYTYGIVQNVTMPLAIDPTVVPPAVFQTERFDQHVPNPNMIWSFPGLDPGDYKVNLYFAELYHTAAGQRTFDIYIEGNQVADELDIFSEAGGRRTAMQLSYVANITDGSLAVEFVQGLVDNPKLNAIEITPAICAVEPPVEVVNNPLVVDEGATAAITNAELVYDDSVEQPDEVIFTVTAGPANGTLNATTFTQADIDAGTVIYTHDGTETTTDSFDFSVSDGDLFAEPSTFNIQVTPTDDAPVLTINETLNTSVGLSATIDNTLLLTTDVDTDPADLTYTVTGGPAAGLLSATTFTQAEINAGSISYTHDGSAMLTDSFTFTVSDLNNTLTAATFNISIAPEVDPNPFNLTVTGDTTTYPLVLTYSWMHRISVNDTTVPGVAYRVVIMNDGATVVDEWFNAATICTGVTCQFQYLDKRPDYILRNGTYSWWVGGQMPDGIVVWSDEYTFDIDVPPTQLPGNVTVLPNQGRPTISWDDDPAAMWFQVYIGDGSTAVYQKWIEKTATRCDGTRCTLLPDVNLQPGEHEVWVRAWGPNGMSTGGTAGWAGPVTFTVANTAPAVVSTGFNTLSTVDGLSLTWDGVAHATWYRVWIGQSNGQGGYTSDHMRWYPSTALDCLDAGTCTLSVPTSLQAGTYTWAVQAWGPAGFNAGNNSAWSAYQTLVINP